MLLLSGDAALIFIAYVLSVNIRMGGAPLNGTFVLLSGVLVVITYVFVFYLLDLYALERGFRTIKYLFSFLVAASVATLIVPLIFFFLPVLYFGRGIYLINASLVIILTYLWRLLFEWSFQGLLRRQKKLLIIGAGKAGRSLFENIKCNPAYALAGFVDDDPGKSAEEGALKVLGNNSMLQDIVLANGVDTIVVAIKHFINPDTIRNIMLCKMNRVKVYDMPTFYEQLNGKIPPEHINDNWFVTTPISGVEDNFYNNKIKTIIDFLLSLLGLFATLPITLPTAIAIKLESRGPVFYRQRRVGMNGVVFDVIKFRSMHVASEKDGVAVWAKTNDPRVTRVGKFIRKTRIDEIPQMWSVLKGHMSFIGPRPERPEFVVMLNEEIPYYYLRHLVKPGITGWAQVSYPYGASVEDALEKLRYDLFYIKNLSPLLDFHILLKTVKIVLFQKGAR